MPDAKREVATLGGGCFWCLEAVFEQLQGVHQVVSGYSGGESAEPTYEEVCTGQTGHAEVVQVTFDPAILPYERLLEVFFSIHDPTQLNRQGADVGTQYRSVVFHHSEEQRRAVARVTGALAAKRVWDQPIVTQVLPFEKFYEAEEYHQGYFRRNPSQPYCRAVVSPKVAKFRTGWRPLLKANA